MTSKKEKSELQKSVVRQIKKILENENISQHVFAQRLGMTDGHVSNILGGWNEFSLKRLEHWGKILGGEFRINFVKTETEE